MKGLIRPELRAELRRWRESLIGGAVAALGLYWAAAGYGLLVWVGLVTALVGTAFVVLGIRSARFPASGDGPGVVEVVERQITYLTARGDGGVLSIDSLVRVEYDARALNFVLSSDGAPPLVVPVRARGSDQLLDALTPLPGIRLDLPSAGPKPAHDAGHLFVIWQKQRTRLH